jgi:hypothetical protein
MIKEFARAVIKKLEEERESRAHSLLGGSCDLAAYKFGCGEIHGLDIAIAELLAMQEKAEVIDDTDD